MPESFDPTFTMQAMRARAIEQAAQALMARDEGLGELQAYRSISMERIKRDVKKDSFMRK